MLTVRCQTFWVSGSCPYGERCCFIHTELPYTTGPQSPRPDENENVSLLPRIALAKRIQHTDSDDSSAPYSSFQFGAQKQKLKIDTSRNYPHDRVMPFMNHDYPPQADHNISDQYEGVVDMKARSRKGGSSRGNLPRAHNEEEIAPCDGKPTECQLFAFNKLKILGDS